MTFHADLVPLVEQFFALSMGQDQLFGLFFLLGTFTVATLSDVRHMAAQREFFQVWLVFVAVMGILDANAAYAATGQQAWLLPAVKWGLIAVLAVLSHHSVGVLFRLARADVAAMAATAALLTSGLIVIFWVLLKVFDLLERPVLRHGRGDSYPFMPVVTSATLAILALGFYLGSVAAPI